MKRIVTPLAACVCATIMAAPAFARDHSHYKRHAVTLRHSHDHFGRYAYFSHHNHWRHRRMVVQQPLANPFANPFAWQQQTAWQQPTRRQQRRAARQQQIALQQQTTWQQPQPAPFATPAPAAAPFGWQQPAVATYRRGAARDAAAPSQFASLVSSHAQANGIPESLVHRVIMRESRYNPRAVSKGNYGIMQIRLATARAMGYTGSAAGLLDPNTNMTYAVRYLAGAYRAAGGNANRAVGYYAGGYYHQAKRAGSSAYAMTRPAVARYGYRTPAPVGMAVPAGPFRPDVF